MPIHKPWLIHQGHIHLATDIELAARRGELEAVRSDKSEYASLAMPARRGKVGVIDVHGPIVPNLTLASYITSFVRGGTILETFSAALLGLAEDESCESIVLHFDSPGGQVSGVAEAAELIASVSESKPVYGYASGMMCSAAYWMGSACRKIVASPTAEIGSIGCVMVVMDDTEFMKKLGIQQRVFKSGVSPKKWGDPFDASNPDAAEQAASDIQATVDAIGDAFVSQVAANRRVSRKKVVSEFGQGGTMLGAEAARVGMVDSVGSFNQLIESLQKKRARKAQANDLPRATKARSGDS
jgi:capsid assembly protease